MSSESSKTKYIISETTKIYCPKPERVRRIKNGKDFCFSKPSKNFNLDLISINEINKDFSEFKSRKEEMKVKKELLNLIKKVKKSKNNKNNAKYKRPENPLYSSYHDIELFI